MYIRPDEAARLDALRALEILDTPAEAEFDALVRAASLLCAVPISLVSLVDADRQWFKANLGLPGISETPRDVSFCAHAILGNDIMEVPDATLDARFADNPLVTGEPKIRFYAGVPLRAEGGAPVGTLCIIDRWPMRLDDRQREILRCLGIAASAALENVRIRRRNAAAIEALEKSEAQLRRSETFLNRTGSVAGIGGWHYDFPSQVFSCSDEAFRIHGVAPIAAPRIEVALGFLAPDARSRLQDALAEAEAHGTGWDLELPMTRADGVRIWIRSVGMVEFDDGRPVGVSGAVQDVTHLVGQRQALQTAYERLSLATELCGIGIWDWDLGSNFLQWDRRMFEIYGIAEVDDVLASGIWRRLVQEDNLGHTEKLLWDSIESTQDFETEFGIIRPDGSVRTIHAKGRITCDETGRPIRMTGADWDVTELRNAMDMRAAREAADRALQAKSAFLAMVSHEIRSPLSGLIGVLELLQTTQLDPEQSRMASMIHNSADMLMAVLNDILDFSKIEAGALSVQPEPVWLRSLIAETVQPSLIKARANGLDFNFTIAPDVPDRIVIDPLRLRQILNNLLSNALKFTARGEVVLDARLEEREGAPRLCISVRDTGIGMTAEVTARLFQPFMQADASTTRRFGGTGLGLSISHKLATLMGGELSVTSRPDAGSVFWLILPLQACAPVA